MCLSHLCLSLLSNQDEPSTLQLLKKHLVLEQTIEDYAETIGLLSQQCRQLLEMGHPDWWVHKDTWLFSVSAPTIIVILMPVQLQRLIAANAQNASVFSVVSSSASVSRRLTACTCHWRTWWRKERAVWSNSTGSTSSTGRWTSWSSGLLRRRWWPAPLSWVKIMSMSL